MSRHRLSSFALSVCLAAAASQAAEKWTPELAFKVKRVSSVRVSPDGSRVAFVVGSALMEGEKSEWLSRIHVAKTDGSSSFVLTAGEKSASAPGWSPDGRFIAFLSSRGKEDKNNLWRIRVDGGEAEQLTEEKGGIGAFRFSPDGRWIAFAMSDAKTEAEEKAEKEKRDARVLDENLKPTRLYVVPVEKDAEGKRPPRKLTTGSLSVGSLSGPGRFDWSPDGRTIAFTHQPTPHIDDWTKSDVSLVDVASGELRPLATTKAAESDPAFSPDGRLIAFQQSDSPPSWGFRARVAVVPAAGGAPRLLAETHDGQPGIVGWTRDGRILVAETYKTASRIYALPADGGAPTAISPADLMVDGSALNDAGTHLGFTSQAPDQAPEAHVSGVLGFAAARVSRVQDLPPIDHGKTEVVTWKAPDGKEIEGLLTYPVAYEVGARVPLLVVIHGGPAGVFVRSFTGGPGPYPVTGFANRGFAVLRCNVRGSSGYGAAFRHGNAKDWGGGDYRDIQSGVDALIARGIADPDRLGVMGWSYGGYMTSWTITQTKRFKAASVGAGVTNLVSFTGTADIPSFIPDYFGGEFWGDPKTGELWRARSAMFQVKGVTTPTLIQHGEQDLRVPISQGYELYNALRRQGVAVKMVVYPRTPHGIQEPKLTLDAMTRNLEWFERWVLNGGAAATTP